MRARQSETEREISLVVPVKIDAQVIDLYFGRVGVVPFVGSGPKVRPFN